MQVYLAAAPSEAREAASYCRTLAHVAYRIGPESTLLRQSLLLQTQGGLLCVSDREAPFIDDPQALSAAALRECGRRSYTGVLLDFEAPPTRDRLAFVEKLGQALSTPRRTLYLPERYAGAAGNALTLLDTALSGGNFTERLQEAATARGGANRLALDIQRLRMDFPLPARTGEGKALTAQEFQALIDRESPAVFFSQDLCARYFTYTREGATHFVLFDDGETLLQKVRIGNSLGIPAAFFTFPEVRDVLPVLFPGKGGARV